MSSSNVLWQQATVERAQRQKQNGHQSAVLWFTGLSGSGKSTLAHFIEKKLYNHGCHTYVLDGDNLRHGLCADLSFSAADRTENIRRVGEVAKLMVDAGVIILTAFISPFRADRERLRESMRGGEFIEIYCQCPIEVCEKRDVKGLYRRARSGEIVDFTGISSPYEEPFKPELVLDTAAHPIEICAEQVMSYLQRNIFLPVGYGAK